MATDFRDIQPAVDSRLEGEAGGGRLRRSRRALLDGDEQSLEPDFALPSARAETGALLERQLLISGGLEDARLPRSPGDYGARRFGLIFILIVLTVAVAGAALYVQYRKMQDELRAELGARAEEIAAARADNERLRRAQRETGLQLEKTSAELTREAAEKQRIAKEAERTRSELLLARRDVDSLRSEIGELTARYRKLEAERLEELGALLRHSLLLPLERLGSMLTLPAATVGPLPRAAPLVEPSRTFTERTSSSSSSQGAAPEGEAPDRADGRR